MLGSQPVGEARPAEQPNAIPTVECAQVIKGEESVVASIGEGAAKVRA